jgi:opacity protein-like surface antigen
MIARYLLAATVIAAGASAAQAQVYDPNNSWGLSNAGLPPGPYIKAEGGGSFGATSRFDDSWVAGAGIGYRFLPFFRSDITFDDRPDFHDGDFGDTRFHDWSAMINGYFDFNVPFLRPFIPYVGAGAGIAQNRVNGTTVMVTGGSVESLTGSNSDQFAWQVMAGGSWYFTPTVALDVSYRYFHGGLAETGAVSGFPTHTGDFDTHEIVGALRFGF